MCRSKYICAVLIKRTVQFKSLLFSGRRVKKVNSSKNDRFRYKMIGEARREMELLEEVAFIYRFSLKADSSIPFAVRI